MTAATFTLTGDLDSMVGSTIDRSVYVVSSTEVTNPTDDITYQRENRSVTTGGEFSLTLPADDAVNLPHDAGGPQFYFTVMVASMEWIVPAQSAGSSHDISEFVDVVPTPPSTTDQTIIDNIVAGRIAAGGSATRGAVDTRITTVGVAEGSAFSDIGKQAGVDPTGTTECSAAINTALTAILAFGGRAYARGTFKISSTVIITGNADLGDATFNWTGANTGNPVQVGTNTSGVYLFSKTITLPRIVNTMKVGTGWAGSSVGVKAINTLQCTITVPHVSGFVTNYYAYGLGTGNAGNTVHLRSLENGKRNLALGAGTGGWCNSNTYFLGWLAHFSNEGTSVSGTRQIELETATNIVNGNTFLGGTIEGDVAEYHIDCDGLKNEFIGIRYETTGGARVRWKANGDSNMIIGGYGAQSIVDTWVAGATSNQILTPESSSLVSSTSTAVQVLENQTSGGLGADAVMDPGARAAAANPATAYRVLRTGNSTKMKQAADAADRLILNHDTGRILMGFGTVAPTITWALGSGSPEGVVTAGIGSLYSNVSGGASTTLYVKTSGVGNTGWTAK